MFLLRLIVIDWIILWIVGRFIMLGCERCGSKCLVIVLRLVLVRLINFLCCVLFLGVLGWVEVFIRISVVICFGVWCMILKVM